MRGEADRAYRGWFGIRWVASAVLHGLTVRPFLERFEGEAEVEVGGSTP